MNARPTFALLSASVALIALGALSFASSMEAPGDFKSGSAGQDALAAGALSPRTEPQNAGQSQPRLRVVTYNIRSCEGLDGQFRPERIAAILKRIDADVVALEEVRAEQAKEIARQLGSNVFFGHADAVHGHDFGNAILTRLPIRATRLYPIGVPGRQQRACLRADLAWPSPSRTLHVFAVHLGLSAAERRTQAEKLSSAEILEDPSIQAEPRILLGDFNETFRHQDVNHAIKPLLRLIGKRSWPAPLPLVDLDRIYYSSDLRRISSGIYRSGDALIASDHAPLMAVLQEASPLGPGTGAGEPRR